MAGLNVRLEVEGLRGVQEAAENMVKALRGSPLLRALRSATLLVQRDARKNAPVDTGRLRASITPEVLMRGQDLTGVVGSNVTYAAAVETGTDPHWPPKGALAVWSKRHGMVEFLVRRAISEFGTSKMAFQKLGTKGWRYLERALVDNKDKIYKILEDVVDHITSK